MSAPSEARKHLADAHRIVVKLGTHVVTHDGIELALRRVMGLVESMARLRHAGREILLVSSGAVGMGMRVLGLKERPRSLGMRQACAAVGQGHLMGVYTQAFAQLGVTAAQVLLTQEDLADRDRALCLRTTLMRLLEVGALPVLNENDSVSVRELVEYRRAQTVTGAGDPTAVVPAGTGDNEGLSARQRGALVVNEGALRALGDSKASLLPIGVVSVDGTFDKGDVVEIRDGSGRVHGRGLVNYPSDACRRLAGRHSDDIDAILGWRGYDALITRDNLVMGAL